MTLIKDSGVGGKSGLFNVRMSVPNPPLKKTETVITRRRPRAVKSEQQLLLQPTKLSQSKEESTKPDQVSTEPSTSQSPELPNINVENETMPNTEQKDDTTADMSTLKINTTTTTTTTDENESDKKATKDDVESDLRDLQIKYIREQKGSKREIAIKEVLPSLLSKYPNHLSVLLLDAELKHESFIQCDEPKVSEVLATCQKVMEVVDTNQVAAHFGRVLDKSDEKAMKERKEFEKQRDALTQARTLQLTALIHQQQKKTNESDTTELTNQFSEIYREWSSFVDLSNKDQKKKYITIVAHRDQIRNRNGAKLKQINTVINEGNVGEVSRTVYEERMSALESIVPLEHRSLVQHWLDHERCWNVVRFPQNFTLF
jgi:hypothetical protein